MTDITIMRRSRQDLIEALDEEGRKYFNDPDKTIEIVRISCRGSSYTAHLRLVPKKEL